MHEHWESNAGHWATVGPSVERSPEVLAARGRPRFKDRAETKKMLVENDDLEGDR